MTRITLGLLVAMAWTGCTTDGYGVDPGSSGSGIQPVAETRVSIDNTSAQAASVTLDDGELALRFDDVEASTATEYLGVDPDEMILDSVAVIIEGVALEGTVDLVEGRLNIVVLSDDAPPVVETLSSNSSGGGGGTSGTSGNGGNGGGDPGAGNGGW